MTSSKSVVRLLGSALESRPLNVDARAEIGVVAADTSSMKAR